MENEKFEFHAVGTVSDQTFKGEFEVKPILTFRERALVDNDKRMFMFNPSDEGQVNGLVADLAVMISQIKYRAVKKPDWAIDLGAMVDENVVTALFERVMLVETSYRKKLAEKAEEAKKALATPA